MSQPVETDPPQVTIPDSAASGKRWLPLIGAIALTVVAVLILVYELVTLSTERAKVAAVATANAPSTAPVPLNSQPISFLDQPAPVADVKFTDSTGKPLSLSDFRGRAIVLNVWATWCLPCRKEMPSLDRLQAKFDPAKLLVLTLSIDRGGVPAVEKFYADLGLKSLGIYIDQTSAALHQLGLFGIPGTLLVNADGQEIARKLGPDEWDNPEIIAMLKDHFSVEPTMASGTAQ